jgi:hypothetical protein
MTIKSHIHSKRWLTTQSPLAICTARIEHLTPPNGCTTLALLVKQFLGRIPFLNDALTNLHPLLHFIHAARNTFQCTSPFVLLIVFLSYLQTKAGAQWQMITHAVQLLQEATSGRSLLP